MSPRTCARSYKPIESRLSTETRLIPSTTALIRGSPLPAITRRSNASADPRYRAGSFPSVLYAARVAVMGGDSRAARGTGSFSISSAHACISAISSAGAASATTSAPTQATAVRGHFCFSASSIVMRAMGSHNLSFPYVLPARRKITHLMDPMLDPNSPQPVSIQKGNTMWSPAINLLRAFKVLYDLAFSEDQFYVEQRAEIPRCHSRRALSRLPLRGKTASFWRRTAPDESSALILHGYFRKLLHSGHVAKRESGGHLHLAEFPSDKTARKALHHLARLRILLQ